MRSERMTGLARKLMSLPVNFSATAANQWFERTLDDSAIRRMDLAQAFLLADAILRLYINITSDMVVYPKQIEKHLLAELPFMATEKILMACVEKGKSRQEMHEVIRDHSVQAGLAVKHEGTDNDLLRRLAGDERIPFTLDELNGMLADYTVFTGRAAEQTREYLEEVVTPRLNRYGDLMGGIDASLKV
jgi:adenylosuccinate lyase